MAEKIGVYIDESSLAPLLAAEDLVAFVKEKCGGACPIVKSHKRLSSPAGLDMIKADVATGEIDAVLLAGTSPRVDWEVFDFGDKVLVERVNLREFVVLAYKNPDGSAVDTTKPAPRELVSMKDEGEKVIVASEAKVTEYIGKVDELLKMIEDVKKHGVVTVAAGGAAPAGEGAAAGTGEPVVGGEPSSDFGFGSDAFATDKW